MDFPFDPQELFVFALIGYVQKVISCINFIRLIVNSVLQGGVWTWWSVLRVASPTVRAVHEEEQEDEQLPAEKVSNSIYTSLMLI